MRVSGARSKQCTGGIEARAKDGHYPTRRISIRQITIPIGQFDMTVKETDNVLAGMTVFNILFAVHNICQRTSRFTCSMITIACGDDVAV